MYMNKKPGILGLIYTAHQFLTELETNPKDYGTGEMLYSSEIHTITAVAENPGCNLTQLADHLGVSKAAVSKFVKKTINAGYICKKPSASNGKHVLFSATEKGKTAAAGHKKFEQEVFGPLRKIELSLPKKEAAVIRNFLLELGKVIRK